MYYFQQLKIFIWIFCNTGSIIDNLDNFMGKIQSVFNCRIIISLDLKSNMGANKKYEYFEFV